MDMKEAMRLVCNHKWACWSEAYREEAAMKTDTAECRAAVAKAKEHREAVEAELLAAITSDTLALELFCPAFDEKKGV